MKDSKGRVKEGKGKGGSKKLRQKIGGEKGKRRRRKENLRRNEKKREGIRQ